MSDEALLDKLAQAVECSLELLAVYEANGVRIWLQAEQEVFDGHSALDLIADGRVSEVLTRIAQLVEGAFA